MICDLNETHDPTLKCSVESAHDPQTDFPIQNLPFGVFSYGNNAPRIGVAIGNRILDLRECRKRGLLDGLPPGILEASAADSLNGLMALGPELQSQLRRKISHRLQAGGKLYSNAGQMDAALVPMDACAAILPVRIGDYTDFYASIYHARNVGSMFRPDAPLFPNYRHVPVGYHARASSVVVTGTPVRRPCGQLQNTGSAPDFGPSCLLDYELEVGAFIGRGNPLGEPIPMRDAESHLFGLCLVNDWSARDIQKWEYQPLGPFLGKSFATTISPWIITMEALAPYRVPAPGRDPGDPVPLPYLSSVENSMMGGIELGLEVLIRTEKMRSGSLPPSLLSCSSLTNLYWTLAQLVTHHASNGCNLRPGDLLASGTVSGAAKSSRGCLLELTWQGQEPILLPDGEVRRFLEDGDEVIFRARAERKGFASIGFGECSGAISEATRQGKPV